MQPFDLDNTLYINLTTANYLAIINQSGRKPVVLIVYHHIITSNINGTSQ